PSIGRGRTPRPRWPGFSLCLLTTSRCEIRPLQRFLACGEILTRCPRQPTFNKTLPPIRLSTPLPLRPQAVGERLTHKLRWLGHKVYPQAPPKTPPCRLPLQRWLTLIRKPLGTMFNNCLAATSAKPKSILSMSGQASSPPKPLKRCKACRKAAILTP